ncbi:MAG: hypothetical protein HY678_07315, partial [Chloroflexi bacterium]|nr:hypothetical protein [Chloroflexota bacterium]
MTGEERAAWAALAAFGSINVTALVIAAILRVPDASRSQKANGHAARNVAQNARASAGATAIAFVAALGAAFSLAFALGARGGIAPWLVAVIGLAFASVVAGLYVGAGAIRLEGAVNLAAPLVPLLARLTRLPGVERIHAGPAPSIAPAAAQGVPATLAQDLDRLQQTGLNAESGELRMIRAVLSMDTARVREIMRPRVDMVAIRADASPQQAIELINQSGHSKVPLYGETIDDIVGVVYARDLLKLHNGAEPAPAMVRELARPAIHVPESQRLE